MLHWFVRSKLRELEAWYFTGRLSRKGYVIRFVVWHLVCIPIWIHLFFEILFQRKINPVNHWEVWLGCLGLLTMTLFYWERMNALRFQDMGRPRKHLWLIFPEVELSFQYHFLDLFLKEGDSSVNQYGKPHK